MILRIDNIELSLKESATVKESFLFPTKRARKVIGKTEII